MEQYYTSSSGERKKISEMNTEYIINALAKKMREIYDSPNFAVYLQQSEEMEALKQEYYKRLNLFVETLEK